MGAATVSRGSASRKRQPEPEVRPFTPDDYVKDCPVLRPESRALYEKARKAAVKHSADVGAFLKDREPRDLANWLKTSTRPYKTLFQPWSMEILFLVAVRKVVRFSELEEMLGISSRTLSSKLQALTKEGFLERVVHDEQPVRIEYRCSKHGMITVSVATPLFTHLNAVTVAAQDPERARALGAPEY